MYCIGRFISVRDLVGYIENTRNLRFEDLFSDELRGPPFVLAQADISEDWASSEVCNDLCRL